MMHEYFGFSHGMYGQDTEPSTFVFTLVDTGSFGAAALVGTIDFAGDRCLCSP